MTNETTASQPKSIGDDAQFRSLMNAWDASEHGPDADRIYDEIAAYIDSRAPEAQASATIQAAPDAKIAIDQYGTTRCASCDANLDINEEHGDDCSAAATIQEPVMVAEPVGEVVLFGGDLKEVSWTKGKMPAPGTKLYAVPMVADPAGVAKIKRTIIGLRDGWGTRADADAAIALLDAATVKAVPSEARIANLEAALRYYAEGNHFTLSDPDAWDTVSGEPFNFQCDEAGTAMVEDGSIAKMVLAGEPMPKDDEEIAVAIPKSEGADAAPLADKTDGAQ